MSEKFDLIVIGSGPAGGTAANICADAGLKTAVIEYRGFGGTCPLRGCNPKKVLHNAAEVVARAADMKGRGIRSDARIDWQELMRFKRSFTEPVPEKTEKGFREKGIRVFHGRAVFDGPDSVTVAGSRLRADKILVGAGAIPRPLEFPGSDHVITSDRFLELESLPESLLFLGGGFIAFELAHVSARLGRKVTILEVGDRPLSQFDRELVDVLLEAGAEIGIEVHTEVTAESVEKTATGYRVRHGEKKFEAAAIVNGAGRIPDIQELGLETAEVNYSDKGIEVNEFLQSTGNPNIYAAGDAADTPFMLTPTAAREAEVAVANILEPGSRRYDNRGIPSIMFTIPPLAAVGLTAAEAEKKDMNVDARLEDTSSSFISKSSGLRHSAVKIVIEKESRRILGAHLLGRHVEEVINIFSLAIRFDLTADDLLDAIYTYPSATREIKNLLKR
ncbi:MAG: NAD(P)/FAD-dependent oxidoreductase [Desulfobacterales bacterium]